MAAGKLPRSRGLLRGVRALVVVAAISALSFGDAMSKGAVPAVAKLTPPLDTTLLEDGDLVFRAGRDMSARLVLTQGESPRFSHVGVVIRRDGDLFVVHAVPGSEASQGGVLVEPLTQFVSPKAAAGIGYYRIKGLQKEAAQKLRSYALSQIGKPFDLDFQYSDDASVYCTELVLKAVSAAGVELAQSIRSVRIMTIHEQVFPPDYLSRSARLETIWIKAREG